MSPKPPTRATSLAAAILAKVPMMALVGEAKSAAKVESAVRELVASQVGFIRIGNPLVSPLSMERVVLQITKDEADELQRDDAERVLRALIARSDMRRQIVVMVEQAETLAPDALEFLHGLPALSHPSLAPVQVALVGSAALGARIAGDNRVYVIGNTAQAGSPIEEPSPVVAPPVTETPIARKSRQRSEILLLCGLAVCGALALAFMFYDPSWNETVPPQPRSLPAQASATSTPATVQPSPATIPQAAPVAPPTPPAPQRLADASPAPAPAEPPVPAAELPAIEPSVSTIAPPVAPAAPPLADPEAARGRLYREFTAFLNTRSVGRRLSAAEREALLQEYLARSQATPSGSTAKTLAEADLSQIPGDPRVLLFFAAGSDPDHVAAEHQADLLTDRVAGVDLLPSTDVPVVPTIRYEYAADRPAALALAQAAPAPGGKWQVEDMTASPQRPQPGTIEMWLPRR